MATIHELYGIMAENLENQKHEYEKLLEVVRMIVAGEIDGSRMVVAGNTWELKPEESAND